jgi:hypothetical protein
VRPAASLTAELWVVHLQRSPSVVERAGPAAAAVQMEWSAQRVTRMVSTASSTSGAARATGAAAAQAAGVRAWTARRLLPSCLSASAPGAHTATPWPLTRRTTGNMTSTAAQAGVLGVSTTIMAVTAARQASGAAVQGATGMRTTAARRRRKRITLAGQQRHQSSVPWQQQPSKAAAAALAAPLQCC